MTTYRPIDSKREEFRKYLERAGVMDALTKVLVALYEEPEKPVDAMEKNLGDDRPERCELDAALNDLADAQNKIAVLEETLQEFKARLEKYEPIEEGSQNE
ncbi:C-Myc-binding protein, putative [Pediculus humanus corporis]|uniref:c-Myc-binding protein, putative n=1 Tax=Pediculus humanus subsp. corporis TaxID=121224 RepID=E0VMT1_PEDHC|nr:C-Myc-binding protein, putative [Pediculus humanus corporis]EEB14687.1 C-Myc-binding protein, putative [Pediculus humanus corporis]